ncbi:MAG TPA: sulfurtransferase [Chloroflexota bacterium]|nr:sulfurtransferase [Chloroflexota bacterium]HUM67232.1 sulfurtransferase [Chloroflexota bacterium]
MSDYAYPEMLASPQWAADHLNDPNVRFVEAGFNPAAYDSGHIPGAVYWCWNGDILQAGSRDILSKTAVEALLSRSGIDNQTTIVVYDGFSNLLAAMALWMLKIYGHQDVRLLDGERRKWTSDGRPLTTDAPSYQPKPYSAKKPDWTLRAHHDLVLDGIGRANRVLVDARTVAMYRGEDVMGGTVGGHIPGAVNVPAVMETENGQFRGWTTPTMNEDGTFKSAVGLRTLFSDKGISPDKEVITYCVRGGLSTHMWFVLKYLLGYPEVREYDGSWAEWGNLIGVPISV